MTGTATPTLDFIAKAAATAIKTVSGMPAEIVHDRQRLIYTREGWTTTGYNFGDNVYEYIEVVGPLSNDDVEQGFRFYYINPNVFAVQGFRSFRDGPDAADNSTLLVRARIASIQDVLRAGAGVMGDPPSGDPRPTLANRGTRLTSNVLQELAGIGLAHVYQIQFVAEQITQL